MTVILLLSSILFFILGVISFFGIFFMKTTKRYSRDDRVDILIWLQLMPVWVSVWMGCFAISLMSIVWAAKYSTGG